MLRELFFLFTLTAFTPACGDDGEGEGGSGQGGADAASGSGSGATSSAKSSGSGGVNGSVVFITAATFDGALGGLDGADAKCAAAATAAGLGGSFKAWISSSTIDAIDRVTDAGPWVDLDDTVIFPDKGSLAMVPSASLWLDETGTSLSSDYVWTGTGFGGVHVAALQGEPPCEEWTSSAMTDQAKVGQVGMADVAWTADSNTTCDQQAHLICLEQ